MGLLRKKKISKIALLLMQVSVLPREKKTGSAIAVAGQEIVIQTTSRRRKKKEERKKGRRKEEKRRLAQEGFKVKP